MWAEARGGKSALRKITMEAGENRIYIATMQPMDNECLARIEKHRGMRAQKNFQTVECYTDLKQVRVPKDSVVFTGMYEQPDCE